MRSVMVATRRRHLSRWLLTNSRTAGGRAAGRCHGQVSPATAVADEPEAERADPDRSAHGATVKADTPAPRSVEGRG